MFNEPVEELIKEIYSNAWFTGAKLKCWVQGKDFIITPNYLTKILQIILPVNVDTTPYVDILGQLNLILEILGADLEISTMGTSIGTARFSLEITTLALIVYSNLLPLTNIGFINLGRARFIVDLIIGAQIDICAHILQNLGNTTGRSATRTCLPFCSLIMKILLLKGIHPPKDGTILTQQGPISLQSLKSSKFHLSAERTKKSASKPPKSESKTLTLETTSRQSTTAPSSSQQPEAEALTPKSSKPQPSQP